MEEKKEKKKKEKQIPNFAESLILVLISLAILTYNIFVIRGDAHVPLIIAACILSLYAIYKLGFTWDELTEGITRGINDLATTFMIFGIIGMMIASWTQAGVIPTLICYGLKILNPKFFLVLAMVICAIVSTATGSSWTTVGTMGVVFLGIGTGFGIPAAATAGACISGAYFGDKISPLSDTTNLAPTVAGATLFGHVRHMLVSSGISLAIAGVIFFFMGLNYDVAGADSSMVLEISDSISQNFYTSPILLIVPVVVIVCGILKKPAVPSLVLGVFLGDLCAIIFQHQSLSSILDALQYGYVFESDSEMLSELLSGGGIQDMMWTLSLTLCAVIFGSILDTTKMLKVISDKVLLLAKSTGSLIVCTVLTCLGMNIITGDQYLSIILPGKMYREEYAKRGLAPENLSRALEDSATVTSPLVPWSSCAAVMVGALGIPTVTYLPYCFFSMASPLVSIFLGFTGITITKIAVDAAADKIKSKKSA